MRRTPPIPVVPKQTSRPVQLRLAGAFGQSEHLRRLLVRITVEGVQDERIACAVRQRVNCSFNFPYLHRRLQCPITHRAFIIVRQRFHRCTLAALPETAHSPRSDAARCPGTPRLEPGQRPPGVDESLLHTVLRQVHIPGHPQAQAVHASRVLAVNPLEGAGISGSGRAVAAPPPSRSPRTVPAPVSFSTLESGLVGGFKAQRVKATQRR